MWERGVAPLSKQCEMICITEYIGEPQLKPLYVGTYSQGLGGRDASTTWLLFHG